MKRNASTRLPSVNDVPLKGTSLDVAYRLARAADRDSPPPLAYRLYWLSSEQFGNVDVPVGDESFLVIGRHSLCDVVLDGDPAIALRHLLVRAVILDGAPRLSIVDLHTDLGFVVAGGRENSMSATGPIAFRVGAYAIVALPGGAPNPEELPEATCTRALVAHPYRQAARPAITLLPRALELGESHDDTVSTGPGWTLAVEGTRGAASVELSPLDLQIGVLVGRAPKCNDQLRDVLHEGISRVHVLLREGIAYDLASTQGTFEGHRRIRAAKLADAGTELRLGSDSPVVLRWTVRRSS